MLGTITRNPARCDLAPFSCEIPEGPGVFVINDEVAVRTKSANLPSVIGPFESASIFVSIIRSTVSIIRHFHPLFLRSLLMGSPPFLHLSPWPLLLLSPVPLRRPSPGLPQTAALVLQGLHCHSV